MLARPEPRERATPPALGGDGGWRGVPGDLLGGDLEKNSPKIEFGLDLKSDYVDVCARSLASSRVKCSLLAPVITARENSFRKTASERQTSSGASDLTASHRRENHPAVNFCFRSPAKSIASRDLKIGHRLDLTVLSHSYSMAFFVRGQTKAVLSKNVPFPTA